MECTRTLRWCAATALVALVPCGSAAAAGPSHAAAERYAHRTFVVDPHLGKRRFETVGGRVTVHARDGSTITAFAMVIADSGDGSGQAVLLFRNRHFLGWDSAYDTLHLSVAGRGTAVRVRYGVYRGNDPFCCPSAIKTVAYRWNGRRIVANAKPPLIYGRHGSRLHLAKRPAHQQTSAG
jgi:LppP/LprE lipoprotein